MEVETQEHLTIHTQLQIQLNQEELEEQVVVEQEQAVVLLIQLQELLIQVVALVVELEVELVEQVETDLDPLEDQEEQEFRTQ